MTHTGVIKPRAFSCQRIDIGCLNNGISVTAQRTCGLVIREEKHNVWLFRRLCFYGKRITWTQ
jgi:hypothetical protein